MEQETQMQGSVPRLSMDEMNPGAAHGSPAQQQEHYQQQAPQYGQQPSPQQQAYPQATSPHQSPVQPSPQRKQAAEVRTCLSAHKASVYAVTCRCLPRRMSGVMTTMSRDCSLDPWVWKRKAFHNVAQVPPPPPPAPLAAVIVAIASLRSERR